MNRITGILLALTIIFLGSCKPSHDKSLENITALEKSIFSSQSVSFDKKKADSLIMMYDQFIKQFPEDTLSPKFAFQAGSIAMNSGEGMKAIEFFDLIITKYPQYRKAPLCLFFKGFVYENLLQDLLKAKEMYQQFISKYPENEFVPSAIASIQNLGKTPEQMVREFEAKRTEDSIHRADSLKMLKGKKKVSR
jgi:outer membrane protein assembly factor BamD (BamD/ComL family)